MVCVLFLPLIHGLCAFFRPLLTPASTVPFFASLTVHGLHFTVRAPSSSLSQWTRRDILMSRDKIAARQFLSLNCLATTLTVWRKTCPLLRAIDILGGILGDNSGEGNCESKIVSRQWGDNSCRETSICLAFKTPLLTHLQPISGFPRKPTFTKFRGVDIVF